MSRAYILLTASLIVLLVPSCLKPSRADTVRYFESPPMSFEGVDVHGPAPYLHLLRVEAPGHLGRPMAWRRSEVELAFDERNRWAADPAAQVEKALHEALFLQGPWTPHSGRAAARLEVRLAAYEGVLERQPRARVALVATYSALEPARTGTRRFEAGVEIARSSPEALAQGAGEALQQALTELRAWLGAELTP